MKFYRVKIQLLKVSDSKQDVSISDSSSDPMTYIQWQKLCDKYKLYWFILCSIYLKHIQQSIFLSPIKLHFYVYYVKLVM